MADTKALVLSALILFTMLCVGAIAVPCYLVARRRWDEHDDPGLSHLYPDELPLPTRALTQDETYYVPSIESAEIGRPTTWFDLLGGAVRTIAGSIACFAHLGLMLLSLPGPWPEITLIALGLSLYSLLVGALALLSWRRRTKLVVSAGWLLAMVAGHALMWD